MKKIKRILSLLTALVLCLVPMFGNTLTVNAEGEPTTYYVKYRVEQDDWVYQTGGWSDSEHPWDPYYMYERIKDGDIVVVDNAKSDAGVTLNFNVSLSNLTIVGGNLANVTAKSVDNFYALNDSKSVVNANVKNAYVYDYALVNFNNNVDNLEIISSNGDLLHATVGCSGTVGHVKATSLSYTHFEFYSFAANTLQISDGSLTTPKDSYSETAPAATPAPSAPSAPSGSGEYDDVPKTADTRFNPLWLVAAAAVCMTGSYALKKAK